MEWQNIGVLEIKHKKDLLLPYYPEEEGRAPCWRMAGTDALWAQALLCPMALRHWALALSSYMHGAGYLAIVARSSDKILVLYTHPALEFQLVVAKSTAL